MLDSVFLCPVSSSGGANVLGVNDTAILTGGPGSIPVPFKSNTLSPAAHHRCDVSSELCCPGVKPRRYVSA